MHAENFRILEVRKGLNVLRIILQSSIGRDIIYFWWWQYILFFIQHRLAVILFQNWQKTDSIPIVCNPTTIVNVSCHVEHGIPRNSIFSSDGMNEHAQCWIGNVNVWIVELVTNVKPKWSELSSFLNNGVEESQSKHQFMIVLVSVLAVLEEIVWKFGERFFHVCLDSPWRLQCEFVTILEDRNREIVSRHGSQKEPKLIASWVIFRESHDNFL